LTSLRKLFFPSSSLSRRFLSFALRFLLRRSSATLTVAQSETALLGEEIMDFRPENGVWVWTRDRTAARGVVCHDPKHDPAALHHSSPGTTYDPRGRTHPSYQQKGFHVDFTT
jgi:hypothetical protein